MTQKGERLGEECLAEGEDNEEEEESVQHLLHHR